MKRLFILILFAAGISACELYSGDIYPQTGQNLKYYTMDAFSGYVMMPVMMAELAVDFDAYLAGDWVEESAEIDAEERRAEYIMLRLRLEEGIDLADYRARFGRDLLADRAQTLAPYRRAGLLREENGRLALTTRGMLLSNTVLADLLADE